MNKAQVGIIGGSGVYELDGLTDIEKIRVKTPFGETSDEIIIGNLQGKRAAFLPRHGKGHVLLPTELNPRANIWALKSLGVHSIIAVSAVGSLREEVRPGDFLIPDQLIDRTRHRPDTFFGNGLVAHISFAKPFCPRLSKLIIEKSENISVRVHQGGTYICMEGPAFSTKAESETYRSWSASIIGMTAIPEAKLAREAEICYAMVALVTDYDVWREATEDVSVGAVLATVSKNSENVKILLSKLIPAIEPSSNECPCPNALAGTIMTDMSMVPKSTVMDLKPIVGRYFQKK